MSIYLLTGGIGYIGTELPRLIETHDLHDLDTIGKLLLTIVKNHAKNRISTFNIILDNETSIQTTRLLHDFISFIVSNTKIKPLISLNISVTKQNYDKTPYYISELYSSLDPIAEHIISINVDGDVKVTASVYNYQRLQIRFKNLRHLSINALCISPTTSRLKIPW
jgi:hypothetical protein